MKDMLKSGEMGEENEREKVQSLNNKIVNSWRKISYLTLVFARLGGGMALDPLPRR